MHMSPRAALIAVLAWGLLLSGCGDKKSPEPVQESSLELSLAKENKLPERYRKPTYLAQSPAADLGGGATAEALDVKVGANITSTRGPQPLWDILKRLAKLKNMNVSWASDVDQKVLVDVDIRAEDNFFTAIDNLLRQVDYFHEMQGNTIVVKYKESKQFRVSLPFMKSAYVSATGGNFLGTGTSGSSGGSSSTTEGTVKIESKDNQFDVWKNIEDNLKAILSAWATTAAQTTPAQALPAQKAGEKKDSRQGDFDREPAEPSAEPTRRLAPETSYYTIDRHVGLITVTAPRPLLGKLEEYLNKLNKEMFRQVAIEAKILEVYLQDNSKIGIDWSSVLKDFSIGGQVEFGQSGQIYPWVPATGSEESPTRFVTKVSLTSPLSFTAMLNALEEQGDTKVLANPKLTVLNGQPALISVGKNIAYIKQIKSDVNAETQTTTYTAETDRVVEGVALGVVPSILDKNTVIMHLTPVTTDLLEDTIPYETFGDNLRVGLPKVGIKEMSTMVQVGSNEMLIIGGLIDKVEGKTSAMARTGELP